MDPISTIANLLNTSFDIVSTAIFKQQDQDMQGRIGTFNNWFQQACALNQTPEEVIINEQSSRGAYARQFGSVSAWLAKDPDWAAALNIYLSAAPKGWSLYKKNCTLLSNPFVMYGGIAIALIIFLAILKSILK